MSAKQVLNLRMISAGEVSNPKNSKYSAASPERELTMACLRAAAGTVLQVSFHLEAPLFKSALTLRDWICP